MNQAQFPSKVVADDPQKCAESNFKIFKRISDFILFYEKNIDRFVVLNVATLVWCNFVRAFFLSSDFTQFTTLPQALPLHFNLSSWIAYSQSSNSVSSSQLWQNFYLRFSLVEHHFSQKNYYLRHFSTNTFNISCALLSLKIYF